MGARTTATVPDREHRDLCLVLRPGGRLTYGMLPAPAGGGERACREGTFGDKVNPPPGRTRPRPADRVRSPADEGEKVVSTRPEDDPPSPGQ